MNYFGQWSNLELVRQDGTTRLVVDVLRDVPYVVLLFGASWSGDTEKFFPLLEQFYERHHKAKSFEVIYISRDCNKAEMTRGFFFKERAITDADRLQRQESTEERHRNSPLPASLSTQDNTRGRGAHRKENKSNYQVARDDSANGCSAAVAAAPVSLSSFPSSFPPPLKRVAELTPGTATNSFSGSLSSLSTTTATSLFNPLGPRAGGGGGMWAVPYEHVGTIGVPLLYHLRVFSYPGVVVCRNRPLAASVTPQPLPLISHPPQNGGSGQMDVANAPRHREKTPVVAQRACYPDVVTIAGRFMIETEDPEAENFPWAHMASQVRVAALFFFGIVIAVTVVVLGVLLPALIRMKHATRSRAAAA
ncbi:tryparedoxin-like protein [Leptomonas pyrrhocoris]|uniref:Tryparedoxin-like protein n=1 Tax=Leptomonas pyrrhocoris TaxID=157538 RepID=A0A0N0DVK2_LEPPY|nr:tryparedoxin-like protein [Leptomonas pyrrhocoris]KPA80472.1 tryparedoxin-like protein [Leptomonas pyrrhocoris]|eukprot:XP_015658911.1 tryparedoxin-like protein [Leptomonas pyrrhocoris]